MSNDHESKIAAALKILGDKKVAKNIEELQFFYEGCDSISLTKNFALPNEFLTTLNIKEVNDKFLLCFNSKVIYLFFCNFHTTLFPDGSLYKGGDLFLIYNNECVLNNSYEVIDEPFERYSLSFSTDSLKKFKANEWLNDLAYLTRKLMQNKKANKLEAEKSRKSLLASNIDLGDFKY